MYSKMNPPVKLREQVTRQNLRKEFKYAVSRGLVSGTQVLRKDSMCLN